LSIAPFDEPVYPRPSIEDAGSARRNSAKPDQAVPNKIAWICLVLFVRIWTFQWVTAKKIKKIPVSFGFVAERLAGREFNPV
jgi:hypothetical protein